MSASVQAVTYLFSDIEGSTRLWELEPDRMRPALAWHDTISRDAVLRHRGTVVKMTGDGVHAAFDHPVDAVAAVLDMQLALSRPDPPAGLALRVRCGLHVGADERRRGDFFGPAVNRAARIMSVAHGGQILVSEAVARDVRGRLPTGVSLRDLGSVRLRDLSTPERLYQVVHPSLRGEFPALRSLEATPNNLAQQLNRFIGRERELEAVRALLHENRLVTLLGMGGLGKSRLSVQLGAEVMDDYPDGVWMVELAPLADPALVAQALASVVGVKEEAGRPVIEALVKFVRDRRLLIILDNCEHVVHACAELAKQLLQASTKAKVLASSRDPLQIAGETVFQLAPLDAPGHVQSITLDALERSDAVQLFVDRATAAQPAFRLTEQNAAAVASICHRLDGIPLALELAAARTRSLSAEGIAARLDDRFRLLVSGDRTALPRQRTLRALIDWSYDLLSQEERHLFQDLAVFAGGWTLEAAESIGASETLDPADVLDLLTHLVEKSLVIADIAGNRYRMLDTVRHYAQEKLRESGQADGPADRHLRFYVQLAETARSELVGPHQGEWLARLDREFENLLAAHARCDKAAGGGELGLRLVFSIRFYLLSRGLLALGERLSLEAAARQDAQAAGLWRCRGLAVAGQFLYYRGLYGAAREHLAASLSIARALGDEPGIVGALQPLGMACLGDGDLESARRFLEEAVERANAQADPHRLMAAINALVQLYRVEGRLDAAEPLCDRALEITRAIGDEDGTAINLLNKAMVSISRGAALPVASMLLEVLDIGERIGSRPARQSALEVAGALAYLVGDSSTAARLFGAAEAEARRTGLKRDPTDEAFLAPLIKRVREALGAGYAEAERRGGAMSYDESTAALRAFLCARV